MRIIGLDFSGGTDAGRKVWLATGALDGEIVRVVDCRPAVELPNGTLDRAPAMAAVRQYLLAEPNTVVGFDFPPSLPLPLVQAPSWLDFARGFAVRFGDERAFRDQCRSAAGGRELKRRTDRESKTPFCAYNLRMYRQTYFGIRELLAPLAIESDARVVPLQSASVDGLNLLEICPASTLKRLGLYAPYKGRGPELVATRRKLAAKLRSRLTLDWSATITRRIAQDTEGDALDSIIALAAAARAIRDGALDAHGDWHGDYRMEGIVFT